MEIKNELIVSGYCFGTAEDAELARQEAKKIEYLEKHMDYEKPDNLVLVYKKAVEERIFHTPIGWEYLKELKQRVSSCAEAQQYIGQMQPIPLFTVFAHRMTEDKNGQLYSRKPEDKPKTKNKFLILIVMNIALLLSVAAMFAIAATSNHPNIINYENTLVNKYASWEQELSDREEAVKEKEMELKKKG